MKIWTLTINDGDGITTEVFTDRALLDAEAEAWVKEAWNNRGGIGPTPTHWPSAVEWLQRFSDKFLDWIEAQEHEIEVPEPGLTKREIFAAQNVAALLTSPKMPEAAMAGGERPVDYATRVAVKYADALIEALKGT